MDTKFDLHNEDCFDALQKLEDNSIDMILCDPPYGKFSNTKIENKDSVKHLTWDKTLNWFWICKELYRVIKPQRAICLFCQDEFTFEIYQHMLEAGFKLKHHWYWEKSSGPNFASLKYGPCKKIEEILVFYKNGKEKFKYLTPEVVEGTPKKIECIFYNFKTKEKISSEFIFDNFLNVIKDEDNDIKVKTGRERERTCSRSAPLNGTKLSEIFDVKVFSPSRERPNIFLTDSAPCTGINLSDIFLHSIGGKNDGYSLDKLSAYQSHFHLENLFSEKHKGKFEIDFENKKLYRIMTPKTGYPSNILKFTNIDKDCLYKKGYKHHPTQKPVELLKFLINHYTEENETVLDFTMGSGSTGVACKKTKRNFVGIELLKCWFDVALERIQNE